MITLRDTFNNVIISKHRTVLAAVKAERKHLRDVKRANGRDSFLTYSITGTERGRKIDQDDIMEAKMDLDNRR